MATYSRVRVRLASGAVTACATDESNAPSSASRDVADVAHAPLRILLRDIAGAP